MSNALYIVLNVVYVISRDMDYVGFTNRHISAYEHPSSNSSIGSHMEEHGVENPTLTDNFSFLKKCSRLVHEMSFIRERKPPLNVQSDSILAKFF